ncbi:MAG: F0F1 ATP synthase subunit delta [Spirochaetaceae bacterium]|jgi:F0F1-type ATP synthase delta subunit|nr:F0F1 ATP synthase subunit delta [Spirochaetaceae bacterium]
MFAKERWAAAFINTAACDLDNGLEALRLCARFAAAIPKPLSGRTDALALEKALRRSMERACVSGAGAEYACRFLCLLVRKGRFTPRNSKALLEEIERLKERKQNTLVVRLDSAFPLDEDVAAQVKERLRRASLRRASLRRAGARGAEAGAEAGAEEIRLITRVEPELLGGCRLQIGSRSIDGSLRFLLQNMGSYLQAAPLTKGPAGGMA